MGRIPIQVMGFVFMTLFMGILGGMYPTLTDSKNPQTGNYVALYALTFFFANWGPNTITFILPSELFPARFRATAHGFCAAWGKAGAIIGLFGFQMISDTSGLQNAFYGLTVINFVGLLCTYPIPEPTGRTLEDITSEIDDLTTDLRVQKSATALPDDNYYNDKL